MSKIALVGFGYWGKNHFKTLKKLKDEGIIEKITVCDLNKNALRNLEKEDEIEICYDWKKLLTSDIDLVSIVSPTPLHYEMAKEFMLRGKDVLVEKPLAMNANECDELIEISEKTGSGLMVGHIFRFHTGVVELRNMIRKGDFGDILNIFVRRQTLRVPRKDMGVLLALGIHEVDIACFLLNEELPEIIYADTNSYFGNTEEMALIIQKFKNTTAYFYESWIDPSKGKFRELTLIGTNGSASLNFSEPDRIAMDQS